MRTFLCGAQWQPAQQQEVTRFHTDAYVQFLQQLSHNGYAVADDAPNFVLNLSVCFTETAWCASCLAPRIEDGGRTQHLTARRLAPCAWLPFRIRSPVGARRLMLARSLDLDLIWAWLGLAWLGLARLGLAWPGLAWPGLAWLWLGLALAWLGLT